jgi:DNA-binding NtrC family response regulator
VEVVLLVEDDPAVADITSMVLEDDGYEVLNASGADEATKIVAARKDICVVLTDMNLKGRVDGLSMVQQLRSEGMTAAVVIMSGDLSWSNQDLGNIKFLAKPYDLAELRRTITQACERYRDSR